VFAIFIAFLHCYSFSFFRCSRKHFQNGGENLFHIVSSLSLLPFISLNQTPVKKPSFNRVSSSSLLSSIFLTSITPCVLILVNDSDVSSISFLLLVICWRIDL